MLAQTVVDKGSQATLRPGRRTREEGFVDFCTIAAAVRVATNTFSWPLSWLGNYW